jgi:uncharacterized protein YukE
VKTVSATCHPHERAALQRLRSTITALAPRWRSASASAHQTLAEVFIERLIEAISGR